MPPPPARRQNPPLTSFPETQALGMLTFRLTSEARRARSPTLIGHGLNHVHNRSLNPQMSTFNVQRQGLEWCFPKPFQKPSGEEDFRTVSLGAQFHQVSPLLGHECCLRLLSCIPFISGNLYTHRHLSLLRIQLRRRTRSLPGKSSRSRGVGKRAEEGKETQETISDSNKCCQDTPHERVTEHHARMGCLGRAPLRR